MIENIQDKIRRVRSKLATWAPPGHFYSPIVDPKDRFVVAKIDSFANAELPLESGLAFDSSRIRQSFSELANHFPELPFKRDKEAGGPLYYYSNPRFSFADGVALGLVILQHEPARIIEIGSGYSSCAMLDLRQALGSSSIDLTFVEPYPEILESLVPSDVLNTVKIIRSPVQAVPLETFSSLEANDILFVDSTHVSKTASDVNYILFEVVPRLKPGVLIHFHDIFYPFEYPPAWILVENRSWNEAFLLRAFLQYNNSFEVLCFNHYAQRFFREEFGNQMPIFFEGLGGSIWLRRVR